MSEPLFLSRVMPLLGEPTRWRLVAQWLPSAPETPLPEAAEREGWSLGNAHAHAYRELLLVLRGESWYGVAGRLERCAPVTACLFDPYLPHDFGYDPTADGLEHLWLSVLPSQLFVRYLAVRGGSIGPETPTWVLQEGWEAGLLHDTCEWCAQREDVPVAVRRLRLLGGLATVLSAVAEQDAREGAGERQRVQETAVDAVCRHLEETAGRGASLDALARLAGYSKYHFARLFKARTGRTVQAYIDRCRLRRTRRLQAMQYTQAAIAEELGFASASSFCRWLRQQRSG